MRGRFGSSQGGLALTRGRNRRVNNQAFKHGVDDTDVADDNYFDANTGRIQARRRPGNLSPPQGNVPPTGPPAPPGHRNLQSCLSPANSLVTPGIRARLGPADGTPTPPRTSALLRLGYFDTDNEIVVNHRRQPPTAVDD